MKTSKKIKLDSHLLEIEALFTDIEKFSSLQSLAIESLTEKLSKAVGFLQKLQSYPDSAIVQSVSKVLQEIESGNQNL